VVKIKLNLNPIFVCTVYFFFVLSNMLTSIGINGESHPAKTHFTEMAQKIILYYYINLRKLPNMGLFIQ